MAIGGLAIEISCLVLSIFKFTLNSFDFFSEMSVFKDILCDSEGDDENDTYF